MAAAAAAADHLRSFPSVSKCKLEKRETHSIAADLDGTLLVSRSSFPYFFLLAVDAGGFLRGLLLLLLCPIALLLYKLVSESSGIQLLIFLSTRGLRMRDIELSCRAVLPKFYAADVRADSWRVFRACGGKRVVVTANPVVMVETFVKEQLGGVKVLGTELEVDPKTGRATGFVKKPGVLVGELKKAAVEKEFAGSELPELGLGDRESDHHFMKLCKEAYMVYPDKTAERVPSSELDSPVIFHDGRLVLRPDPLYAWITLLWLPFGFALSVFRIFFNLQIPVKFVKYTYALTGIKLIIHGRCPPPPSPGSPGRLLICNHRTGLDPIIVSIALQRNVSCVAYSISRLSYAISPIPTLALSRDRAADAAKISAALAEGDLVICPEGTTCREEYLLRFSALFAELSDRIVPVALRTRPSMFYGTTVRGWKFADSFFYYMNPRPVYEITFLDQLPPEQTCRAGGKSPIEVANNVQKLIAGVLGFECTALTRKDKYMKLGNSDGKVESLKKAKEN